MSAMSGTGKEQNSGQTYRRQTGSMKAMFGFLTPQGKDSGDPLQSAKAAAAWLRELPALDVIGRLGFKEINIATIKDETPAAGKP